MQPIISGHGRVRADFRFRWLPFATLSLLSLTCLDRAGAATLTDDQQQWLHTAHRRNQHGWIFVHVEGEARARGFQHGYLLAREIAESIRAHRAIWENESALPWSWLVDRTRTLIEPRVDAETRDELDGLAEGLQAAGVTGSRTELVADNAFFELAWYWWPKEKEAMQGVSIPPPKQSCSAFIATGQLTADGGVVLGHNSMVDYPEATANVIMDIKPARGQRILWQTWPGWLHSGTDFFVTGAGLVGAETTLGAFEGYDTNGIPEFVRMRRATQDATSIDEWCAIMRQGNNGGYANAWLLGDVRSGEIARLELGLRHVGFERKRDGCFLGSNITEDRRILRFETKANENDIRISNVARRERWKQLMAQNAGRIDRAHARQFESDHFDVLVGRGQPGSRTLCGHVELDRDPQGAWPGAPYYPCGTFDGKVVDTTMARRMSFEARWGAACGRPFDAPAFLAAHPQYEWMRDVLRSRPTQPWTTFQAEPAATVAR